MSPKELSFVVRESLGGLMPRLFRSTRPYTASVNPNGRLVADVNGFNIGYIVDAPFFDATLIDSEKEGLDAKIDIAANFEGYAQRILKDLKPRYYSGLHPYSHVYREAQIAFELAKRAGVPLGFATFLLIIGHDVIEDRRKIKELLKQFEESLTTRDYTRMNIIGAELKIERKRARNEVEQNLLGYLKKTGVKGALRAELEHDVHMAADLTLDVTRFPDRYPYPVSMGRQYKIKKSDLKDGAEGLLRVLTRSFGKDVDRIGNLEEYTPPDAIADIARLFADDRYTIDGRRVGKELRERYGAIRAEAEPMPPAVRVDTGFKSVFPLQYQNETLNENWQYLANAKGKIAERIMLVRQSKPEMINATIRLFSSAEEIYESDKSLPRGLRAIVDREIEAKKRDPFYYEITLDGPAKDWIVHDAVGRRYIESLDRKPSDKEQIYRDLSDLMILVPMFGRFSERGKKDEMGRPILVEDPNVRYDPRIHDYFTLQNVNDILKFVRGDKYTELVARRQHQFQLEQQASQSSPTFRFW